MKKGRKFFLKSRLGVLVVILVSLAVACGGPPANPEQSRGVVDDATSLQKVTLVVPTIF